MSAGVATLLKSCDSSSATHLAASPTYIYRKEMVGLLYEEFKREESENLIRLDAKKNVPHYTAAEFISMKMLKQLLEFQHHHSLGSNDSVIVLICVSSINEHNPELCLVKPGCCRRTGHVRTCMITAPVIEFRSLDHGFYSTTSERYLLVSIALLN